jgi:hypothetical protein
MQRRRNLKKFTVSKLLIQTPRFRRALFASVCRWLTATLLLATANPARAAEPLVNLSVNQLSFPAQGQGTASASQLIVLANSGEADLSISGIAIDGENKDDFVQTNNCPVSPGMLAPRSHCEIRVIFAPTVMGSLSAALNVADNASGSPHSVVLKGLSTAPGPVASLAPVSLAFGNQPQGSSSVVRLIVLTNTGSGTLSINSQISINGPAAGEFRIQPVKNGCPSDTGQLAPKTSCEIGVVFAPATLGVKNAQVLIVDDAPGSPHSIELSGTATSQSDTPKANP